jgi:hypothetical protein
LSPLASAFAGSTRDNLYRTEKQRCFFSETIAQERRLL